MYQTQIKLHKLTKYRANIRSTSKPVMLSQCRWRCSRRRRGSRGPRCPQSILGDRIAFIVAGENGEGPLPGRDPGGYHLPALSVDLARSIGTENPAERMGIGYLTDPCRCHGALPRHRRILVDRWMDPGASERERWMADWEKFPTRGVILSGGGKFHASQVQAKK